MVPETVVVTGASAGLGRAIARLFGKHHAQVALLARGDKGLEGAAAEVESAGGKALTIPVDVADADAVDAAAEKAERHFGPIDIWINNAMATILAPFVEIKPEEYKRATEVTYLGVVYGTLAALHRMQSRNRGTIVQVGSAMAYRSIPLQSAYCGAKHAIVGFTDSLRSELLHDQSNIRLTMVQMPAMNTTQFRWMRNKLDHKPQPVPPIFEPEVGARAVYWAAHHNRREIYVGMPSVGAIMGTKIAPGLLDKYLAKNGYSSQQTNQPQDHQRSDNLFTPMDAAEDQGTHGSFSDQAHKYSPQVWANLNRRTLGIGIGVTAAVAGALIYRSLHQAA